MLQDICCELWELTNNHYLASSLCTKKLEFNITKIKQTSIEQGGNPILYSQMTRCLQLFLGLTRFLHLDFIHEGHNIKCGYFERGQGYLQFCTPRIRLVIYLGQFIIISLDHFPRAVALRFKIFFGLLKKQFLSNTGMETFVHNQLVTVSKPLQYAEINVFSKITFCRNMFCACLF